MAWSEVLSGRLRHLLHCRAQEDRPVSYRSCTEQLVPLRKVLERNGLLKPRTRTGLSGGELYVLLLLKKVIVSHVQLLCVSEELKRDVKYAFAVLRELCAEIEHFNDGVSEICSRPSTHHHYSSLPTSLSFDVMGTCGLKLSFSDVSEVVLEVHSEKMASDILKAPLPERLLQQTRFEARFLRAFLGTFATYSSLLGHHRAAFVSDEAFSLVEDDHQTATWLDCLIPGAQSDALKRTEHLLLADLWSRVSSKLTAHHILTSSQKTANFVTTLSHIAQQDDMAYHSAAVKGLWHTVSALQQQKGLTLWDAGFQGVLASSHSEAHKCYRLRSGQSSRTGHFLLNQTLPHCHTALKDMILHGSSDTKKLSLSFAAQHVDLLRQSQMLRGVLQATLTAVAVFLVQGLSGALASWNLKVISRLLFVEGPVIVRELERVVSHAGEVCSPQLNFPSCSGLHLIEWISRHGYSILHSYKTELKEALEGVSVAFHDGWSRQCRGYLKAVFPPNKFWKALGKRNHLSELSPSSYCEVVKEQLLLPVVDAAGALAEEPQKAFVGITVCILMNEFRWTLTSYKKAYRPGAGRQLLTDYRHILHWLTSTEVGLEQGTVETLQSLPMLMEIEQGLLTVCGTANCRQQLAASDSRLAHSQLSPLLDLENSFYLFPAHRLGVFNHPAWHSPQDWLECIAK